MLPCVSIIMLNTGEKYKTKGKLSGTMADNQDQAGKAIEKHTYKARLHKKFQRRKMNENE